MFLISGELYGWSLMDGKFIRRVALDETLVDDCVAPAHVPALRSVDKVRSRPLTS